MTIESDRLNALSKALDGWRIALRKEKVWRKQALETIMRYWQALTSNKLAASFSQWRLVVISGDKKMNQRDEDGNANRKQLQQLLCPIMPQISPKEQQRVFRAVLVRLFPLCMHRRYCLSL